MTTIVCPFCDRRWWRHTHILKYTSVFLLIWWIIATEHTLQFVHGNSSKYTHTSNEMQRPECVFNVQSIRKCQNRIQMKKWERISCAEKRKHKITTKKRYDKNERTELKMRANVRSLFMVVFSLCAVCAFVFRRRQLEHANCAARVTAALLSDSNECIDTCGNLIGNLLLLNIYIIFETFEIATRVSIRFMMAVAPLCVIHFDSTV